MSLFTTTSQEKRLAVRVGTFVAVALALAGLVVLLIGQESQLFEKQVTFVTYFENVEGLTDQSPVWLGGLKVGRVEGVGFPSKPGEKRLEVRLKLNQEHAQRVRADSVVRLTSMGVLGDKAVDITVGSPDAAPLPEGAEIKATTGGDLASLMRGAAQVMEDSMAVSRTVRKAAEVYANPQVAEDMAASVHSLRNLLQEVETGDGALHALIYDKQTGQQVRVEQSLNHVEGILDQVENGQGTAHQLIYGGEGAKALAELGSAAGQLAGLLQDAKDNPNGAVHQLFYGDAGTMFADLGSAAADIKQITAMVARGEGSLGGLIKDPTVYEDLRLVVGNVRRNKVLRALVRFAINNNAQAEEQVAQPIVVPPEKAQRGIGGAGAPSEEQPKGSPLILPLPPPVP